MKTLFTLVILLIVKASLAQNVQEIPWSSDRPLTWADYQAPVDTASKYGAVTYYGDNYTYRWKIVNGHYTFTFNVNSFMARDKSWTKVEKQSPHLLKHEQLHFDIAEFFARQLLAVFKGYNFTANYKAEIEQIHQNIANKRKAMEELYDEETNHSKNKEMQAKWELYVAGLLANN